MKTWKHFTFVAMLAIFVIVLTFVTCDDGNETRGNNSNGTGGTGDGSGIENYPKGSPNPALLGTWYNAIDDLYSLSILNLTISANELYFQEIEKSSGEICYYYIVSNLEWIASTDMVWGTVTQGHVYIEEISGPSTTKSFSYINNWLNMVTMGGRVGYGTTLRENGQFLQIGPDIGHVFKR